jgi:hypothetical protein
MEELPLHFMHLYNVTYRKDTLFDIFVQLFFINEIFSLPTAAKIEYCISNNFTYDSNKSCVIPVTLMIWYMFCVMITDPFPLAFMYVMQYDCCVCSAMK